MEKKKQVDPDSELCMDGSSKVQHSNNSCDINNDVAQTCDLGICCESCNNRLVDLKKQALKLMITQPTFTKVAIKDSAAFCERLQVPKHLKQNWVKDQCTVCTTSVGQLKHEAVSMVQSLEATHVKKDHASGKQPTLVGSRDLASLQRYVYTQQTNDKDPKYHRQMRQARAYSKGASPVVKEQTKKYLEENFPGNHSKAHLASLLAQRQNNIGMPNGSKAAEMALGRGPVPQSLASMPPPERIAVLQSLSNQQVLMPLVSNGVLPRAQVTPVEIHATAASLAGTSAAASFFARAAQKLNLSSKKKKRHHQGCLPPELPPPDPPLFPTNFCQILRVCPPAAPPSLLRNAGRVKDAPGSGKVKVMLRVVPSSNPHDTATFVTVDQKKKQVTLFDPSFMTNPVSSSSRRTGVAAPKMFAFDSVFPQDSSQAEVCAASIADIVQAVVNGADGCLFCFGHSRLGKSFTMIGRDDSVQNLGVIPCAIEWLFRLINEKKEKTSTRFSVRVSAVEVHGKQENLKDLLADQANGSNNGCGTSPGIYLAEDPICGVQLLNQSELRAPSAEKAAFYLDAAVAARKSKTYPTDEPVPDEESRNSHMLFTLHVYQYRFEKSGKGGVMGGRSRLHLIDLGSCDKGSRTGNGQALSFSSLGNVVLALLNSDKHIPHRDSKLTQLLRESLGSINCRATMIAHVSSAISCYNETLSTIQQAARIHRRGKKKAKYSGTSSSGGESSCEEGRRRRTHFRSIHTKNINGITITNAIRQSDPEYISSSEQSCDTVIYVGPDGCALSDRDLTDNEGPPESVPIFKPSLGRLNESRNVSNDELHSRLAKIDNKVCRKDELKKMKKDSGSESDTPRVNVNHIKTVEGQNELPFKKSGIPRPSKSSMPSSNKRPKKSDSASHVKQISNGVPNNRTEIQCDNPKIVEKVTNSELDVQSCKNITQMVESVPQTPDDEEEDVHNNPHEEYAMQESNFENIKRLAGHVEEPSPTNVQPQLGGAGQIYNQQNDHNTQHNIEYLTQSVSMPTFTDVSQACPPNMDMLSDYVNGNLNGGNDIQALYDAERVIHSVESLDTIAELLERPVSELSLVRSEDEMSLVYSEVGSFVSTKTDDLTSLDQVALTVDDMPLGSEACCLATLDRQSLDSLSENFDANLNTASVCANTNNPVPFDEIIDRELRNRGHYVYSDDESEIGEKKERKSKVEKPESESSVEIRLRDLDAIKSMYVISNLSVDDLFTDDPNDGSISTMADFDIPNGLLDEPQVVTYMTVEDEGQVVMREKHLAVDHPLRRLSCISDATDATFSTNSRPSSFISQEEDEDRDVESEDFSSGFMASDIQSVEEKVYTHPGYVPIYAMHLFDKMTEENAEVWEKMDTITREASQKRRMSNQSNKNSASSESTQRTISHLDTSTILPCAKVNPFMSKVKVQEVDPRGYTSEDNCLRGSLHKHRQMMADEPEDRKTKQKMSKSQSEPTSVKCSPLHLSNMNQLNVEPLPTVLCNAIAKVEEERSLVENRSLVEKENFLETNDMWLLRQPDGAADIQSEPEMGLKMHERRNCFRHELKQVEEKEVFEAIRPPTIGACSSPTFDVEEDPCYSQDDPVAESTKSASKIHSSMSASESSEREKSRSRGLLKPKIFSKSDKSKNKKSDKSRTISMQGKSYSDTESSSRTNLLSNRRTSNSSSKLPTRTSSPSKKGEQTARNALKSAKSTHSQTKCKDSSVHGSPATPSSKKPTNSKIPTAKSSPSKTKLVTPSPKTTGNNRATCLPVRNKSLSKSAPTLSKNSTNNVKQSATSSLSDFLPTNNSSQTNGKLKVGNRLTDSSDSGNDSGIVCAEKSPAKVKTSLLSPYSTMTEPRKNRCSSSGHGSDNSSTVSDCLISKRSAACVSEETSSGYDSMLRESAHDAISSSTGKAKALKHIKRKLQGPRRSRSASPKAQTEQTSHRGGGNGGSRWIDLPPRKRSQDEGGVALKLYNVEKVNTWQADGNKGSPKRNPQLEQDSRQDRIMQLTNRQQQLKQQLVTTKALLNVDTACWTFDLHVLDEMDPVDELFVDALERETQLLEERVNACKAHVMVITSFDIFH